MSEITIKKLLDVYGRLLGLKLVAGAKGLERTINSSDAHRPEIYSFTDKMMEGMKRGRDERCERPNDGRDERERPTKM